LWWICNFYRSDIQKNCTFAAKSSRQMDSLILELKEKIIKSLNLEEVKPEDIADDAPLFGEGLSLDSIDALELIVLMEKHYGIKLTNPSEGKEIFKSVRTMAEYIAANRTR
jgi:acyl carrier protein